MEPGPYGDQREVLQRHPSESGIGVRHVGGSVYIEDMMSKIAGAGVGVGHRRIGTAATCTGRRAVPDVKERVKLGG